MKIIKSGSFISIPSGSISVITPSGSILSEGYKFSLIPREYPTSSSLLSLELRNQLLDRLTYPSFSWIIDEDYLNIFIPTGSLRVSEKFEFTLNSDNDVLYKGLMMMVDANKDIQNYKHATINNDKITF